MSKGKRFCLCAVYQGLSELVRTPAEGSSYYPLIQRGFYCRLSSVGPGHLSTLILFTREQWERHKIMFKYSRQLHLKIGKKFPAHTVAFVGYEYFQGSASVTVKYKKDLTQHFNTSTNERGMYSLSCWFFLFSFFVYFAFTTRKLLDNFP